MSCIISNNAMFNAAYKGGVPYWDSRIGGLSKAFWDQKKLVIADDNYTGERNETWRRLFNVVVQQVFHSMRAFNHFEKFEANSFTMGGYLQEIFFTDLIKARKYKGTEVSNEERIGGDYDQFGIYLQHPKSAYHQINRREWYPITDTDLYVRQAFLEEGGLFRATAMLMELLSVSNRVDTELYFKRMMVDFARQKEFPIQDSQVVELPDITIESSETKDIRVFLQRLANLADLMSWNNSNYNAAGRQHIVQPNEVELFIDLRATNSNEIQNWALTFNPQYQQYKFNLTKMDNFGEKEVDKVAENIIGIGIEKKTMSKQNVFTATEPARNAVSQYTNHFLHVHELYRMSPAFNVVYFVRNKQMFLNSLKEAVAFGTCGDADTEAKIVKGQIRPKDSFTGADKQPNLGAK